MRMALWGATVHPLAVHYWFNNLERWLGPNPVGASKAVLLRMAFRKVVVDQLMSSPVFLGSFLVYSALGQGKTLEASIDSFKENWFTMVKGGWSCWPLAHMINFAFVPVQWRVLYVNFVQLGFGTFLSMMGNSGGGGVLTPIDSLYQKVTGKDDAFGNVESVAKSIGASWILGGASMAYNWRHVGWTGLGCSLVWGSAAILEISIVMEQDRFWRFRRHEILSVDKAAALSYGGEEVAEEEKEKEDLSTLTDNSKSEKCNN
mmetsp:Transcript_9418/g.12964  ORF Transcript_9418/g.12964 Transcript_9418/m.12964 type:complete len:260 (+) Transcript_9418:2-781(+)